jgi:hypothetical protein
MTWLERLHEIEGGPPTNLQNQQKPPFVGFVGSSPRSEQKNEARNDTFVARVDLFSNRGLAADDASTLAAHLAMRDVSRDDRIVCLECRHLSRSADRWRCSQGRLATATFGPEVPRDMVSIMHRCAMADVKLRGGNKI